MLEKLVNTLRQVHHHFVHLFARNANAGGASIEIEGKNAKQDIIPAIKQWLLAHPDNHGVVATMHGRTSRDF